MASISLRNVTKRYSRHVTAVRDLSLEIAEHEFMVIVGPSGCGKTTTLSLIAGLEEPTSGEIRIADRIVNSLSPRERDVAMVFQDGVLYPHLSVHDNLAFPLRMRNLSPGEVKRRIGAVVDMLGIAELLTRKPAALSGGQRQRVALGRAMVREPAAFLLDEPLTNLDARLRLAMRAEIKALHARLRTTTLYVTHDQSEAMALGQRICVLRDGRAQQIACPGEIYDRPVNRFVAGFFGTPAMNFLPGHIRRQNDTLLLDVGGRTVALPLCFRPLLDKCSSRMVTAGIRPHDLSLEPSPGRKDNLLCGKVTWIEPLGSETDVHVELAAAERCVVAAPPRTQVRIGDEIRLYIDLNALHLFEPDESGRSILCSGNG